MTQEDLEQIRGVVRDIVREETRAVVREETRAVVREETLAIVREAISANNEMLFAAMRAMEEHFDRSIAEITTRLDHMERRLAWLESRFTAFEFQLAGIGKSLVEGERLASEMSAVQSAQRRAIDDLVRRMNKIEQHLNL